MSNLRWPVQDVSDRALEAMLEPAFDLHAVTRPIRHLA
jgi:hypothetical protein